MKFKNLDFNIAKRTLLLTLYGLSASLLAYTFLSIVRYYYPSPDMPAHTEYIYYGGLMATLYLVPFVALLIMIVSNGRFIYGLIGPQSDMRIIRGPIKALFLALNCGILFYLVSYKIVPFVTKQPIIILQPSGMTVNENQFIAWDDIKNISIERFKQAILFRSAPFRCVCITLKNDETIWIAEPDMYSNVPTALQQIEDYRELLASKN